MQDQWDSLDLIRDQRHQTHQDHLLIIHHYCHLLQPCLIQDMVLDHLHYRPIPIEELVHRLQHHGEMNRRPRRTIVMEMKIVMNCKNHQLCHCQRLYDQVDQEETFRVLVHKEEGQCHQPNHKEVILPQWNTIPMVDQKVLDGEEIHLVVWE